MHSPAPTRTCAPLARPPQHPRRPPLHHPPYAPRPWVNKSVLGTYESQFTSSHLELHHLVSNKPCMLHVLNTFHTLHTSHTWHTFQCPCCMHYTYCTNAIHTTHYIHCIHDHTIRYDTISCNAIPYRYHTSRTSTYCTHACNDAHSKVAT